MIKRYKMKKADKLIFSDSFKTSRIGKGYNEMDDNGDPVFMVLRHKDVRQVALNWKIFQSGAHPGRIVVPSEMNIRKIRQIPFEVDPPEHGLYRAIVEPWFRRPLNEEYQVALKQIINEVLKEVADREFVELIHEFSLILQSRALTLLLNTPGQEAATWISWGTHVFRSENNPLDASKADVLYDYIDRKIDQANENPDENFYSFLLKADYDGRKLTKEEIKGILILTFAGGRDTVINILTNTITYFATSPESFEMLKKDPSLITTAVEELVRYFSPLTHMGRIVSKDTQVCEHAIKANSKVSLCWASANRDESVFEDPDRIKLDRKMNPHVGFGFGPHNCLGATHARQVLKLVIEALISKIHHIDVLSSEDNIERLGTIERKVGYQSVLVKFNSL